MRAKRVDKNHTVIKNTFEKMGATVTSLHELGQGAPDLLVGFNGVNLLVEVKIDSGKLNERQIEYHQSWKGLKPFVIRTIEEAERLLHMVQGSLNITVNELRILYAVVEGAKYIHSDITGDSKVVVDNEIVYEISDPDAHAQLLAKEAIVQKEDMLFDDKPYMVYAITPTYREFIDNFENGTSR